MQGLNWNDLRVVLAVGRGRTLAGAARRLGVDGTTVARRLAAAERRLGARLADRAGDGTLHLTEAGEDAALRAERMEGEVTALAASLSGRDDAAQGTVRVTAVPIVVNRILAPAAPALLARHPGLRLELIAEAQNLSLTRREADLAVRLARPRTGGSHILARRIGALPYAVYAAAGVSGREARALLWITYDDTMAHLPQAAWIAAAAARTGAPLAPVRVNDAEGLLESVAAGLGRSLLPRAVADADPRLHRLGPRRAPPALTRELWLLQHAQTRTLGRIKAVGGWVEKIALGWGRG